MSRKQYSTIQKRCEMCGDMFDVCSTVWHNARVCPKCRPINDRRNDTRRARERRMLERRKKPLEQNINIYKMIRDADCSWGYNTHLSLNDINKLLKDQTIAPGTEFRHLLTKKEYRVIRTDGKYPKLKLEVIKEA